MKAADKIKAYTTASMTEADGKHIYRDRGSEPLPSASEILRIFSFGEFANVNQEKLDEATHIGHTVHDTIAGIFSNEHGVTQDDMVMGDIRYQNCMRAYGSWLVANKNIVPLAVEKQFASQELGFGGTVDFIGLQNGELTIWDWKTGNQIKHRDFIQMEIYSMLLKKCCGLNAKRLVLVHLSKETGEYKERICPDRRKSRLYARQTLRFWKQTEDFKRLVDGRRHINL